MIEILEPHKEFNLPFKKDKATGDYLILPNHIGGKNSLRDLAASKIDEGYMYLIRIKDSQTYKIGVSTNPKRRLRDIASVIPYDLEVLALNKMRNVYKHEQALLNEYSDCLIRNEWFAFTIDQAKEVMIKLHNKQVEYEAEKH